MGAVIDVVCSVVYCFATYCSDLFISNSVVWSVLMYYLLIATRIGSQPSAVYSTFDSVHGLNGEGEHPSVWINREDDNIDMIDPDIVRIFIPCSRIRVSYLYA